MKRKILLTVRYLIEADKNDFWDSNGYLQKNIKINFKKRFPQKIKISDKLYAKIEDLSHIVIDYPNANLLECPACKRLITDRTKPNPIEGIRDAIALDGVLLCKSCAWQLEMDVEMHGIEHVLDRFKD